VAGSENRAGKEGGSGLGPEGVTILARFFCAKAREAEVISETCHSPQRFPYVIPV